MLVAFLQSIFRRLSQEKMPDKVCLDCKQSKPDNAESFHRLKSGKLTAICIDCINSAKKKAAARKLIKQINSSY